MWLLPLVPRLARVAAFVYYRVRYRGSGVPPSGPALLVANHPNSLLDPMLVEETLQGLLPTLLQPHKRRRLD